MTVSRSHNQEERDGPACQRRPCCRPRIHQTAWTFDTTIFTQKCGRRKPRLSTSSKKSQSFSHRSAVVIKPWNPSGSGAAPLPERVFIIIGVEIVRVLPKLVELVTVQIIVIGFVVVKLGKLVVVEVVVVVFAVAIRMKIAPVVMLAPAVALAQAVAFAPPVAHVPAMILAPPVILVPTITLGPTAALQIAQVRMVHGNIGFTTSIRH